MSEGGREREREKEVGSQSERKREREREERESERVWGVFDRLSCTAETERESQRKPGHMREGAREGEPARDRASSLGSPSTGIAREIGTG